MSTATLAPNWDLTPYFPAFDGPEYREFRQSYRQLIKEQIERAERLDSITEANLSDWVRLLLDSEDLGTRGSHLGSYLECLRAADGRDEAVARDYASLQSDGAEHTKLGVLLLDALRNCPQELFEKLCAVPELESASYRLGRMREEASHQMSKDLETLTAELEVDGFSGWGRLYDQLSGKLEFDLPQEDGTVKKTSMSLKVSLLSSPEANLRKTVMVNSNRAWQGIEDSVAACLNGISGHRLTLYRRRNIKHFLDPALFDAAISRQTLDAMMGAIAERSEVPRQYLRTKARLLGKPKLGFQDLWAPLPLESHEEISWEQAKARLVREYGRLYPEFASFCEHAFAGRWIDYEPRPGKRPGGFCTGSERLKESRIFMTYNKTLTDVSTLAHELGHAFHSWVMRDLRSWQNNYPMTLAETASIFAETLLSDAILRSPETSEEQRAVILDARLENAQALLLNIPSRFYFEKALYEERAHGELSVSRLCELMLKAQKDAFGDTIAEDEFDPYFWASKLHFYITEVSFYNFPYSFGFLFSMGVYARARQEGPAFFRRYEELLRLTGSDTAEKVAKKALGVDLESAGFWLDSLALVEEDLKAFEELTPRLFKK